MERTWRRRRRETSEEAVVRLVQHHAADLLRFARQFSLCADDAHDAYQRALEILVRRVQSEPPERPLQWLRTVLKREALAVRAQREQFLGAGAANFDDEEAHDVVDPAEHAVRFERLEQTAEALRRLKPQELTALALRAEGLSYREIAERQRWTYTKVNRAVTEGRRALLTRLRAIESGEECARWLPLLSKLADGEATAEQLAELRPHLRACAGCRGTLRRMHRVPGEVAALVPPALVPVGHDPSAVARHVEALVHGLLDRTTAAAIRVQGALDGLPAPKLAAVAASSAALAGGGMAIEQAATHGIAARTAIVRATAASAPADRAPIAVASASRSARATADRSARTPSSASDQATGEFSFERSSPPPEPLRRPVAVAHAAVAPAAPPPSSAPPSSAGAAEFAGP